MPDEIMFLVTGDGTKHVIVQARNREAAKAYSRPLLGGNPDRYIVTPLTHPGDTVYVHVAVT